MDLIDALRTTGASRAFTDRPVDDATVARILDTARFSPNGGNRQAWRVVVIKDPGVRRALRDAYLAGWYEYLAQAASGLTPWAVTNDRVAEDAAMAGAGAMAAEASSGPGGFAEQLDQVPVLLALVADLDRLATVDRDRPTYPITAGGSIYPFAWSILLAARAEGLGGVMTTVAVRHQDRVASVLGLDGGRQLAAVVALGEPVNPPRRLRRDPVSSFATVDGLDGPPFGPAPDGGGSA